MSDSIFDRSDVQAALDCLKKAAQDACAANNYEITAKDREQAIAAIEDYITYLKTMPVPPPSPDHTITFNLIVTRAAQDQGEL